MTKVFIGGSRRVSRLAVSVRQRIDRIIEQDFPVVIGDANGADKAVQSYLSKCHYQNVEVFCSGDFARNNIGAWHLRSIKADARRGTLNFYTAKDIAMTEEATVGLMVWDGKSIGTLLNVCRLISRGKKVVIYDIPTKQFHDLKHVNDWKEFLFCCPSGIQSKVEQRVADEREGSRSQPPMQRLASIRGRQAALS